MKNILIQLLYAVACAGCATCSAQTNAESFYGAGGNAFNARNYAAALTNFTRAVELNPRHAGAYCGRGMSKWWLQDYSGAIADYDKAIALNPKEGGYYSNRGQARFALHKVSEALADYNKAIDLDPRNVQAHFNRGTLKVLGLTNYAGAAADFTKAIELHSDPQEEDIFFWRGYARQQLKDYAGAIADYAKSIELNTNVEWSLASYASTNLDGARKQLLESRKK